MNSHRNQKVSFQKSHRTEHTVQYVNRGSICGSDEQLK